MYSALIPSVTERSASFVKELSFPQTAPTDDAFFNRNWAGACWDRWAETGTATGPVRWLWTLDSSAKARNKEDRRRLARCLSDAKVSFSLMKEKINRLEGECSAYLLPMGWPGIYSICFSQLDGGKDSFPLDEVFSAFIVIELIRDNEGAV